MNPINRGSRILFNAIWFVLQTYLRWAWLRPITTAQFTALVLYLSPMNLLGFIIIVIGDFIVNLIVINIFDYYPWKQVIEGYLHKFEHSTFEKVPSSELFIDRSQLTFNNLSIQMLFQYSHLSDIYYVRADRPPRPCEHKTYQMIGVKTPVFLVSDPRKMSDRAKFYLFHELGHANIVHLFFVHQIKIACVYFALLVLNLLLRGNESFYLYGMAICLCIVWILYIKNRPVPSEEHVELLADQFALIFIAQSSNFRSTAAKIAMEYRKRSLEKSVHRAFWRDRTALLIRQAQLLSSNNGFKNSSAWDHFLDFNQTMMPPLWLTFPTVLAVILMGTEFNLFSFEQIARLFLIWIVAFSILYKLILSPKFAAKTRNEAWQILSAKSYKRIFIENGRL